MTVSFLFSGLAQFCQQPCSDTCAAVALLLSLGAVPFCYTNVPQTMMSLQCSNPVYGETGKLHFKYSNRQN